MNYVLILIDYFPEYIKYVLNSILSVDKNATIYLAHNSHRVNLFKNVKEINLNEFQSENLERFNELNIFNKTIYDNNPLWMTSVQRIFYLDQIINNLNLHNVVHFDNDVLIYKPFTEIENTLNKDKVNITPYNNKKLIFGYSFIKDSQASALLSKKVLEEYIIGKNKNWKYNNKKPLNEMEILKNIDLKYENLFNLLPSLPYQHNTLFDPAGYGQFIDGTHANPKKFFTRGYTSIYDPIGVEIVAKRIKVKFNNNPIVLWENKTYNLSNLHVHSKRFQKFLPTEYKNYVT